MSDPTSFAPRRQQRLRGRNRTIDRIRCVVLLLRDSRAAYYPSIYLDDHGEEDTGERLWADCSLVIAATQRQASIRCFWSIDNPDPCVLEINGTVPTRPCWWVRACLVCVHHSSTFLRGGSGRSIASRMAASAGLYSFPSCAISSCSFFGPRLVVVRSVRREDSPSHVPVSHTHERQSFGASLWPSAQKSEHFVFRSGRTCLVQKRSF